jgi:hypothetical protein
MVGAFGVLLAAHLALPGGVRDTASVARRLAGLLNALLGLGLLTGLGMFVLRMRLLKSIGQELGSGYHAVIGTKFLLLLAIGACLGIASGKLRKGHTAAAHTLQTVAMILLAMAAFLGFML